MKVYVLVCGGDESWYVQGVYSTLDAAKAVVSDKWEDHGRRWIKESGMYWITEYDVVFPPAGEQE